MNPWFGWALAAAAVYVGWRGYGWPGVAFAFSAIVFWLVLQFSRTLRAMRSAGEAPVGSVDSAVMLNAKLRPRMLMLDVIKLTRSLGQRESENPEVWAWRDAGGACVSATFVGGRVTQWRLHRPADAADAAESRAPAPVSLAGTDR